MAEFQPFLLANIDKPDSHTLAVYESTGGYAALKKVLAEGDPVKFVEDDQGQQLARTRRGRLSHRAEVDVSAQESSRPDLHVHQRRRERAGHVQ